MKTLLCCIARMENAYIREWVEYNKNIGFTNICLYDNNHDGEQDFHDVIGDYIDSGYVILKDYRNKLNSQLEAYNECCAEYCDQYDWLAFFDCDEFLTFHHHANITEYLQHSAFNNFGVIQINWCLYGDNDMLENDGRPVLERFKNPIPIYRHSHSENIENELTKCIVKNTACKVNGFKFLSPHHTNIVPVCNNSGLPIQGLTLRLYPSYEFACLRHYSTKTAREYCDKINRSFPIENCSSLSAEYLIKNCFFTTNDVTSEKVQIFKDVLGVDVSYLLNN